MAAEGIGALIMLVIKAIAVVVAFVGFMQQVTQRKPSSPQGLKDFNEGVQANTCSTQERIKVVYGKAKIGGNDIFRSTTGSDGRYLWIVQTLAEGECEGIDSVGGVEQVFIGDKLANEFSSVASYWFHAGASDQTVDVNLAAAFPEWTDCLRNTCYMVWKLEYDPNYFQYLPERKVILKGKKVYDPRDGSTAYSTNHALCLRDYMTNSRYGVGMSSSRIDDTSWNAVANYVDSKGWALNMGIYEDDAAADIRDNIAIHCHSSMVWYAGKYFFQYADMNDESVAMTLSEEHIAQDDSNGKAALTVSEPSQFEKPDGVRVMFTDPEKGFVTDDIVVGEDTGVINQLELTGCQSRAEAGIHGIYYLERWKLNRTVSGRFRDDCQKLEPHDLVILSFSRFGISEQYMRVQQASILPNGMVDMTLEYEALALYNGVYDLDVEGVYTCTLPDPKAEPNGVSNVTVTEENYNYRLRSFTRIKVSFDPPPTYIWYDHVEVWLSYDDEEWTYLFPTDDDFNIDNVTEGVDYYLRLKVVNIWGGKQQDANDYKIHYLVGGYTQAPVSPAYLFAIASSNSVNLYSDEVVDSDVDVYEFRLGTSWTGGIFLAREKAPNKSLTGVKPGVHTFFLNTKGNNGIYGDTPRSTTVSLPEPPPGWTLADSVAFDTLITNGAMEDDSDWSNYGSPTVNERSSTQKHDGTYSRKFTVDATNEGIQGAVFTSVTDRDYGWSGWVYPDDTTSIRVKIRTGDDSGWTVDVLKDGLTQDAWNFISGTYTETAGGVGAYIVFESDTADAGGWYVDDVCLMEGTFTNAIPVLYSGSAYVKGLHSGSFTGTYLSPVIDRSSILQELSYIDTDLVVTGVGTTWDDVFPDPATWDSADISLPWGRIFEIPAGPTVNMSLWHGETTPDTETAKMEILSLVTTARYYQAEIEIVDPLDGVYAQIGFPTVKFNS